MKHKLIAGFGLLSTLVGGSAFADVNSHENYLCGTIDEYNNVQPVKSGDYDLTVYAPNGEKYRLSFGGAPAVYDILRKALPVSGCITYDKKQGGFEGVYYNVTSFLREAPLTSIMGRAGIPMNPVIRENGVFYSYNADRTECVRIGNSSHCDFKVGSETFKTASVEDANYLIQSFAIAGVSTEHEGDKLVWRTFQISCYGGLREAASGASCRFTFNK